jgi:hypothetical protein
LYFETEMYHAVAKSFVRVWLSVVRERTVLPYDCVCADEFTGAVRRHQTTELRNTGIPQGTFSCLSGNSPCVAPT